MNLAIHTCRNLILGEKTNTLNATHVPLLHHAVWFTAVIDESGLIPIEHTVYAQREEFPIVNKLNVFLSFF